MFCETMICELEKENDLPTYMTLCYPRKVPKRGDYNICSRVSILKRRVSTTAQARLYLCSGSNQHYLVCTLSIKAICMFVRVKRYALVITSFM